MDASGDSAGRCGDFTSGSRAGRVRARVPILISFEPTQVSFDSTPFCVAQRFRDALPRA